MTRLLALVEERSWMMNNKKIDDLIVYTSSLIQKTIYTRTTSHCPECGEPNHEGKRLVMKDEPHKKPHYHRVCVNCKHEWETRR